MLKKMIEEGRKELEAKRLQKFDTTEYDNPYDRIVK